MRWHQADHRGGQPVRARQTHRTGPEHAGVFTCGAVDGGNGVPAVFANEMHDLDAVERAAFAVRGVVRASGKGPSKKRQHFHNSPVGAPQVTAHPLTPQLPCRTEMLFLADFEGPPGNKSLKGRENFHSSGYFVPAGA